MFTWPVSSWLIGRLGNWRQIEPLNCSPVKVPSASEVCLRVIVGI